MTHSWWLASSLSYLALVSHLRGGSERATALYEQSMDLFREQGDKQSLAYCLNNLAMVVYSQGDLGRAGKLTEEAVALQRELGNRAGVSVGLYNLGWPCSKTISAGLLISTEEASPSRGTPE
jgi:tetratricopeptide (TPR) repeat protein